MLKWAGGKRQLFTEIKEYLPPSYNKFYEPFIGGGAVFFNIGRPNSVIGDYNPELINFYNIVKNNHNLLIESFKQHENTEEYYYKVRSWDRDPNVYAQLSDVERASRFLYLNKTCFNGIWRVNRNGQNNVPYGYPKTLSIDETNIEKCSRLLQTTEILCGDFEIIKPSIKKGDFVYFDPPYFPLTETSSFTTYTDVGFDEKMQIRLKEFCDYINRKRAFFMVSNSSVQKVYKLYQNYHIKQIYGARMINANGNNRGKVKETLIINYTKEKRIDSLLGPLTFPIK